MSRKPSLNRSSSTSASRTSLLQVSVRRRSIVPSYRRPGTKSPPRIRIGVMDIQRRANTENTVNALTKARAVAGDPDLGREVEARIAEALWEAPPEPGIADEVLAMRRRLEERAKGRDVKRGFGGVVDIEFLSECLKLVHGHSIETLRTPGTLATLAEAARSGLLNATEHNGLLTAIQFLRSVESRMRIVWDMAQDRIPEDPDERTRLARRLGYVDTEISTAGDALLEEYEYMTGMTREIFETVLARQSSQTS